MREPWVVPWELLGLRAGEAGPSRVRVRLMEEAELEAKVCGAVQDGGTFDVEDDGFATPVRRGLFDEDTFGPLPRLPSGSVDLSAFDGPRLPQLREFGDLPLDAPVLNPWVHRFALDRVAEQTGLTPAEVTSVLAGHSAIAQADGALVPMPRFNEAPDDVELAFGADGLDLRAELRGSQLDGLSRLLPVLPGGLRGVAWSRTDGLTVHDANLQYDAVLEANDTVRRCLDEGAHPQVIAGAIEALQHAVDALFFGADDERFFLARPLTGAPAQHALDALRQVTDGASFVLALRGELFAWRCALEASGLHVELLDASGAVDVPFETKRERDVTAGLFDLKYERVFGPARRCASTVIHGPIDDVVPHVDVYAFEGEGQSTWCVSAGMSTRLMNGAPSESVPHPAPVNVRLCIELACELGACTADEREAVQTALLELALFPFRSNAWVAPLQTIGIGGPLVPGSRLVAWALFELAEDWARRACIALPRHPRVIRVVPITAEELDFKRQHGALALWERLRTAKAEVVQLRRESVDLSA
ncbi:MAG: suppressor of fused domain protein [Myxococcales bacterium]|nr:suppressor of fused domain protein [Myxococcales bacterium]